MAKANNHGHQDIFDDIIDYQRDYFGRGELLGSKIFCENEFDLFWRKTSKWMNIT